MILFMFDGNGNDNKPLDIRDQWLDGEKGRGRVIAVKSHLKITQQMWQLHFVLVFTRMLIVNISLNVVIAII